MTKSPIARICVSLLMAVPIVASAAPHLEAFTASATHVGVARLNTYTYRVDYTFGGWRGRTAWFTASASKGYPHNVGFDSY